MPTLTLEAEILKTLVELGQLAATVDEAMNAGPGGMRLGVDVELHGVARIAPGRARGERGPVRHLDGNLVVIRVDVFSHRGNPKIEAPV